MGSMLKQEEESKSSSNDIVREEMPWESREEKLVADVIADCRSRELYHEKKRKFCKLLYIFFGLPAVMIPLITAGIADKVHGPDERIIVTVLLIFSSMLAAIQQFFNFGKKSQAHAEYSARFAELALDSDVELVKPKRFRLACDVFMERISKQVNQLKSGAPD